VVSAVQNAKRNDVKSTLKIGLYLLIALALMAGIGFGVLLSLNIQAGTLQVLAAMAGPLILAGAALSAACWYYTKKIDQL